MASLLCTGLGSRVCYRIRLPPESFTHHYKPFEVHISVMYIGVMVLVTVPMSLKPGDYCEYEYFNIFILFHLPHTTRDHGLKTKPWPIAKVQ